jgi:methionyl-tRNA synthetase
VQSGLKDLSISRTSIHWGVPVPGDERHVFYVWLDALVGYLSGLGFGSPAEADRECFASNWPAWHLVGKEIVRFHAVYWPAFLMAAGLELPRGIIAHGWLLFEEEKMSKSRGNVVPVEPIQQALGADALRYFLLREVSFGQDGAFSYDALLTRYNSDLANGWGNLASRTLSMIARYFEGRIPYPAAGVAWQPGDLAIMRAAEAARDGLRDRFTDLQFARGLEAVWQLIAALNRYLVDNEPWALAEQTDAESRSRLATVLHIAAEGLRFTAVLLSAVLPASAARLWAQLGMEGDAAQRLDGLVWGKIPVDQKIAPAPEPLFPRRDKAETLALLRAAGQEPSAADAAAAAAAATAPAAPVTAAPDATTPAPLATAITIDDFAKVDLRVGVIQTAERIPGATKLLKLTVDIGLEVRQIVAGIAEVYDPATLPGRKVVIAANLAPRKLRGVESNGMIIAASLGEAGRPALISVPADTPNGARLR